ncbi:MAG: hypothetical protein A3B25_00380 [Candidatus Ryanbacteria bacterium RIFCSPLOWO2_01_FULL_48_26]|uniref:Cohesin domain-containing protein n=1 Tax=Candidatus Ryanbacteria bacterium RIFCSPLOWO2_01_FULL_48_26 TaxID=1802126 RepID=A0A1G2GR88_9BACT|nr:MAG: hypothetical protein A3B25_00380 [Candidatus Ryanbacteria bacterium RIFCSPLOWO2_01_FULL_48_26]OHB22077.1 MAG: hypothetical protein A3J67_00165 [Parcubacteria group bacterium RIFCSPHIGHO2_02_FULL_48_10b]
MNNKNLSVFFLVSCFLFLALASLARGAEIFFDPSVQDLGVGDQFEARVFLNTEDEKLNAFDGTVSFAPNLLEVKEIRDGNSIINFWVEQPHLASPGQIYFSGITPGGYAGENGLVFTAVFQALAEGKGKLEAREARAYLNDGEGTETQVSATDMRILISPGSVGPTIIVAPVADTNPPEDFTPIVSRDPQLFNGKYFLVFNTQDKGSGIDHYEIREGGRPFRTAESPYTLKNQALDEKIRVKAVDKNGNVRIATVPPLMPSPWYKNDIILVILIFVVLLAVFYSAAQKKAARRYEK